MEKQARILLIEDESDIRELIKIQLESKGYHVTDIISGSDAIDLIQSEPFDLFVIDRMLPGISGLEVCKFIRRYKVTQKLPILIVTALSRTEDIVCGLEAGADDYITKPFDMNVLLARVKSLLRRLQIMNEIDKGSCEKAFGKLKINTDQCKVWVEGQEIGLTASEYKLISLLIENARKVLSRKELVGYIQGEDVHVTERTIDTHVFGLRKKLKNAAHMIETIRGIGYRVTDDND